MNKLYNDLLKKGGSELEEIIEFMTEKFGPDAFFDNFGSFFEKKGTSANQSEAYKALTSELKKILPDRAKVISLLLKLSAAEKTEVLNNTDLMQSLANNLSAGTQMKKALKILDANLNQTLTWMLASDKASAFDDLEDEELLDVIEYSNNAEVADLGKDTRLMSMLKDELSEEAFLQLEAKIKLSGESEGAQNESNNEKKLSADEVSNKKNYSNKSDILLLNKENKNQGLKYKSFKCTQFAKNKELLKILHGEFSIKPGDYDSLTSTNDKLPGPIQLITSVLKNTGYLSSISFSSDLIYTDLTVDAVKKLQEEVKLKSSGIIDSATIALIDKKEFERIGEIVSRYPEIGSKELIPIPYQESYPIGSSITLFNANESKIRIYKSLSTHMDRASNIITEVTNNSPAKVEGKTTGYPGINTNNGSELKNRKEIEQTTFYKVTVTDSSGKQLKGIVREQDISINFILPLVEVDTNTFSYLNESTMIALPLTDTKLDLLGDSFDAKVFYKQGGNSESVVVSSSNYRGHFVLRLSYNGDGISSSRHTDIVIPAEALGFSKPLAKGFKKEASIYTSQKNGLAIINLSIRDRLGELPSPDLDIQTISITDTRSLNENWTPSANVHTFSYNDKEQGAFNLETLTIVPVWAEKTGENSEEKIQLDFSKSQSASSKSSLSMANSLMYTLSSPVATLAIPINWMSQKAFADKRESHWAALHKAIKDDYSNKKESKLNAIAAGTLAETCASAIDSLNALLTNYLALEDYDKEKIDSNLLEVRNTFLLAITQSYSNPQKGIATLKQAIQKREFVETKIFAFSIQKNGAGEKVMGLAAKSFFKIFYNTAGRSSTNALLDTVIYSELKKQGTTTKKARGQLFENTVQSNGNKLPESFLSPDLLKQIIGLVSMHYELELANKFYDPTKNHWLGLSQEHKKYTVYMQTMGQYINHIKNAIDKPELSTNYGISQVLNQFLTLLNGMGDFTKYHAALMEDVTNTKTIEEVIPETLKTVREFLVAELITFGLATELALPKLLKSGMTIANTTRAFNAFRFVVSTTIFTAEGYLTSNNREKSFYNDLVNNLLTIGALRASGKILSGFKPVTKLGKTGKFLGDQAIALATLQLYANAKQVYDTGDILNKEQNELGFYSNMAMLTAFSITNLITKNSFENVYSEISLEIIAREAKLGALATEITQLQNNIEQKSLDQRKTGKVTPEYIESIAQFFEKQELMFDQLIENAKPGEKAKIKKARAQVRKDYQQLAKSIELQQYVLGQDIPEAINKSGMFELIGKDRLRINRGDVAVIKKIFEENGGTFEALKDPAGEDMKGNYLGSLKGKSIFFETSRQKTLGQLARLKALVKEENHSWAEVKKEFGINETKAELEILRQAWVEDQWRPGQTVPEKYKMALSEIKGSTETESVATLASNRLYDEFNNTIEPSKNVANATLSFINPSGDVICTVKFESRQTLDNWMNYCRSKGGYRNPISIAVITKNKPMYPWFFDETGKQKMPKYYPKYYTDSGKNKEAVPKPVYDLFNKKGELQPIAETPQDRTIDSQIQHELEQGFDSPKFPANRVKPPETEIQQRVEAIKTKASSFKTKIYKLKNNAAVQFNKVSITHILARHVKEFWLGKVGEKQSWWPDGTQAEDIISIFDVMFKEAAFKNKLESIAQNPLSDFNYNFKGREYTIGIKLGTIMQFYPTN